MPDSMIVRIFFPQEKNDTQKIKRTTDENHYTGWDMGKKVRPPNIRIQPITI
ncbi:MAG TPA: hypothetical protein VLS85_12935 [Hanamia sp.]|nr:hypothetical protein [Hanamia sp.]